MSKKLKTTVLSLGGEDIRLAMDTNAMIQCKKLTGKDLLSLMASMQTGDMTDQFEAICTLIWCMATSHKKEWRKDIEGSLELIHSEVGFDNMKDLAKMLAEMAPNESEEFPGQLAPFVPSPLPVVRAMLELAKIEPGETVVDLGSGDGRLLFAAAEEQPFVTAIGYEMHLGRVSDIEAQIRERKIGHRVAIKAEDIRKAYLGDADVVFLYLLNPSNLELEQKLFSELKTGARIISHDFGMGARIPDASRDVLCEDRRDHKVFRWNVGPVPVGLLQPDSFDVNKTDTEAVHV